MGIVLSVSIIAAFAFFAFWFFIKKRGQDLSEFENVDDDKFSEEYLMGQILDLFDEILQTDYSSLNLNKFETLKNERNQAMLRKALKGCSCGNVSNKMYVRDYVKDLLQRRLGIDRETVSMVIPFQRPADLTAQDKFEILLHAFKKLYGVMALEQLIVQNGLDRPVGSGVNVHYEITSKDVSKVFAKNAEMLNELDYYDYLSIVAQRVYQRAYGLGAIDDIRDMVIDGINCGTSGIPNTFYMPGADSRFGAGQGELPLASYNSIWLMFKGKLVHLSFLGFQAQRELERVAKLVYRYNNPGTLDEATGYIVNFMQDGSRVAVARPPFCESWVFFIRKFDAASKLSVQELYPFEGNEKLVEVLRWIVSGCRNIAITGSQFTGKSTLLSSMVQFIPESFSIRVQEMAFELHLRKLYAKRNITTFSETPTISGQEGIDFSKKTDGTTSIFGEVAQAAVAALAIQMGQVGAAQVMFTHHARTVDDLVEAFRNSMIESSGYNSEKIVERTVARVLNFDVHLGRSIDGMRYIERITEIMPKSAENYPHELDTATVEYYYRSTDRRIFESQDILVYDNGRYVFAGSFSSWSRGEISKHLSDEEAIEFKEFNSRAEREAAYA